MLGVFAPTRGNHYKLSSVHFICSRRGVARKWKCCLPQELSCGLVKGPKFSIEVCRANENQSACRYNGTAIILRASIPLSFGCELRILTEWDLPYVLSSIQIDCAERTPW